jgi:hypothetical protein
MNEYLIWEYSKSWAQDIKNKKFYFYDREKHKIHSQQAGLEITVEAKWHPDNKTECGVFFPTEFEHCPFCGQELLFLKPNTHAWFSPFGCKNGLRMSATNIELSSIPFEEEGVTKWVPQDSPPLPLPRPHGNYHFLVSTFGAKLSILLAFDRISGEIDFFSPKEEKWLSLSHPSNFPYRGSSLPEWSWAAAFIEGTSGFAVPTDTGPAWYAIDWINCSYSLFLGKGKSIGGTAVCKNTIYIPTRNENSIVINKFDHKLSEWVCCDQIDEIEDAASREDIYFSVPVVDEARQQIYWIGLRGLLTFSLNSSICTWRPWETDQYPCRAVPELGPPYRDNFGEFWQLCYDNDKTLQEETYRYYKLTGDEGDRQDVLWAMFGTGLSSFSRLYDHWGAPWDNIDENFHEKALVFRAPLLCLDQNNKATIVASFCEGKTTPLLLLVENRKTTYPVSLSIEVQHEIPIKLETHSTLQSPTPWELRVFIYEQHLYVYSAGSSECLKWSLK